MITVTKIFVLDKKKEGVNYRSNTTQINFKIRLLIGRCLNKELLLLNNELHTVT